MKIILGYFSWCASRAALCASRPGTWGARPAWPAWETAAPAETEARWTGAAGGGGPARRNPCWNREAPPPTDDPRALDGGNYVVMRSEYWAGIYYFPLVA